MGAKKRVGDTTVRSQKEKVRLIEQAFSAEFPNIRIKPYNIASIRIRVIDDRFSRKNRVERENLVLPIIHALPEDVQADIIFLLLLAPGEQEDSLMNLEFEQPTRSQL